MPDTPQLEICRNGADDQPPIAMLIINASIVEDGDQLKAGIGMSPAFARRAARILLEVADQVEEEESGEQEQT